MKKHFELYATQKTPEVFTMPSRRMIQTLKDCLKLEIAHPGRTYGPEDVSGSFLGLYKRGLLDINMDSENKSKPSSWYVTIKGLHFLLSISDRKPLPDEKLLLSNMYKLQQNAMSLYNTMNDLKVTAGKIRSKNVSNIHSKFP